MSSAETAAPAVATDEVMADAAATAAPTTPPRAADTPEPAPTEPAANALEANIKAKGENAYYFAHAKKAEASVLDMAPRLVSKEAPPADKRDAAPAPIVRAVEKYSWADGKKAVTLYVDVPGLAALPADAVSVAQLGDDGVEVKVTVPPPPAPAPSAPAADGEVAMADAAAPCTPPARPTVHVLTLKGLYGRLSGVAAKPPKQGKDTLTVTLTKAVEGTWWNLKSYAAGGGGYGGGSYDFDD